MILRYPLISSALLLALCSCRHGKRSAEEELYDSPIVYPFVDHVRPIGKNSNTDKVVIRSMTTSAEYALELPGGANDYDLEVPLAEISKKDSAIANTKSNIGSAVNTDRELTSAMPRIENAYPTETAVLDGAFGMSPQDGPTQSPSYTLGIAKINEHYKQKEFEYALIEINNLVAYYPTSARLHTMKGTILMKLQNYTLAERAWSKAIELNPQNIQLSKALKRLQDRLAVMSKNSQEVLKPSAIPADKKVETLAH